MDKRTQKLLETYDRQSRELYLTIAQIREFIHGEIKSGRIEVTPTHSDTLYPPFIEIGSWSCEGSPIKRCAYNTLLDLAHDFCMFCGGPDERK